MPQFLQSEETMRRATGLGSSSHAPQCYLGLWPLKSKDTVVAAGAQYVPTKATPPCCPMSLPDATVVCVVFSTTLSVSTCWLSEIIT